MVAKKMKEKCKDAARIRREKERAEFVELSKLLPLPSSTTNQLDKATVIRLTSSYLRMRSAFPRGLGATWAETRERQLSHSQRKQAFDLSQQQHQVADQPNYQPQQDSVRELGSLILQTLDGFVFTLHQDGKIMYISETASVNLGLPQIDLTGSSIFEYIHPSDHNDIRELFNLTESDRAKLDSCDDDDERRLQNGGLELSRSFCMRMKCILPKRNAGLVSNGYKAIHCSGYLKVRERQFGSPNSGREKLAQDSTDGGSDNQQRPQKKSAKLEGFALVAVGQSLLPSASTEVKLLGSSSFMFRALLDFKLCYVEGQASDLLGFECSEMIGQSLYKLVHVDDVSNLVEAHNRLLRKSQVVTRYYRLMRRDGGSVWVQTYANLVNNPRQMPKSQRIVGVCFVLGENPFDSSGVLLEKQEVFDEKPDSERPTSTGSTKTTGQLNSKKPLPTRRKESANRQSTIAPASKRKLKVSNLKSKSCKSSPSSNRTSLATITKTSFEQREQYLFGDFHLLDSTSCYANSCLGASGAQFESNQIRAYEQSIGSTRRPSDDSSSVVSSSASTSVSLLTQSGQDYLVGQQSYASQQTTSKSYTIHSSPVAYANQVEDRPKYEQQQHQAGVLDMTADASNAIAVSLVGRGNEWPLTQACQQTKSCVVDLTASKQTSHHIEDQTIDYYYQHQPSSWTTSMQQIADTTNSQPAHHNQQQYPQQLQYTLQRNNLSESFYQVHDFQLVVPELSIHESPINTTQCNETTTYLEMKNNSSLHFHQQSACLSHAYTS